MLKIDRSSLKAAIKTETDHTHKLRAEAKLLFKEAGATANYNLQWQAQAKKDTTEYGRCDRRSLTLAAAFLNNTPYSRCEPKADSSPNESSIVDLVSAAIEGLGKEGVRDAVSSWLLDPALTRHDILPDTIPECFRAPMAKAA